MCLCTWESRCAERNAEVRGLRRCPCSFRSEGFSLSFGDRLLLYRPNWPRTHRRQDLLSSPCLHQVSWPMRFQGFSCLHHPCCCPSSEVHDHVQLYLGPGDLNSGPYACIANALPLSHRPSLRSLLLMHCLRSPFWPLGDVLGSWEPGIAKQRVWATGSPCALSFRQAWKDFPGCVCHLPVRAFILSI